MINSKKKNSSKAYESWNKENLYFNQQVRYWCHRHLHIIAVATTFTIVHLFITANLFVIVFLFVTVFLFVISSLIVLFLQKLVLAHTNILLRSLNKKLIAISENITLLISSFCYCFFFFFYQLIPLFELAYLGDLKKFQ